MNRLRAFSIFILLVMLVAPALAHAEESPPSFINRSDPEDICQGRVDLRAPRHDLLDAYQEVMTQYDLQPVGCFPEGIEPFRVQSPTELARLMAQFAASSPSGNGLAEVAAFNSPYCVAANSGFSQVRAYADIDITNGYVTRLYGVRTILIGATTGFSLSGPWGYFTSRTPSKYVSWVGGATLNTHILVQGMPVIRAQSVRCSRTFRAP